MAPDISPEERCHHIRTAWIQAGYTFVGRLETGEVRPYSTAPDPKRHVAVGTLVGFQGPLLILEALRDGRLKLECPQTKYLCKCEGEDLYLACPAWLGFDNEHPETKARHLMRSWEGRGCKFVSQEGARIIPMGDSGQYPIFSREAHTYLVRSMLNGQRY